MQLITYSVRLIDNNGQVHRSGQVQFLDSIPKKQAIKAVAQQHQRAEANVLLIQEGREDIA
ncbi:hypothetical protein [Bacillus sp. YIM B13589]|uniref:hypothetical protein n=1 Tax=Bacillus sp. YIM B13589 TaxID=3366871 RepID=UPI003B827592